LALLPAALEIVETPPSPAGRAIVLVIISVVCLVMAWASWATVDIIATAQGKIVPSGRSKVIQPFDTGVVRAIHVTDGQHVSNRDIGFVHPGQPADIKIDTFNYTRYGLLHGEVEPVSGDAVTPDKRAEDPNARPTGLDKNTAASTDTGTKEPVYAARVSLDKTAMVVDDKRVNLAPGMAVTVEIKTGSRHIISYLLSPLLRYGHESLRER
jgi:multidrug efflux pump subunit AcrA (membrane-fusion protein)